MYGIIVLYIRLPDVCSMIFILLVLIKLQRIKLSVRRERLRLEKQEKKMIQYFPKAFPVKMTTSSTNS